MGYNALREISDLKYVFEEISTMQKIMTLVVGLGFMGCLTASQDGPGSPRTPQKVPRQRVLPGGVVVMSPVVPQWVHRQDWEEGHVFTGRHRQMVEAYRSSPGRVVPSVSSKKGQKGSPLRVLNSPGVAVPSATPKKAQKSDGRRKIQFSPKEQQWCNNEAVAALLNSRFARGGTADGSPKKNRKAALALQAAMKKGKGSSPKKAKKR